MIFVISCVRHLENIGSWSYVGFSDTDTVLYIFISLSVGLSWGFTCGSVVKNPPANAGDTGSIPGSGRYPREGNGSPLQYSCLENPMDRGPWRVAFMRSQRVGHDLATKQKLISLSYC